MDQSVASRAIETSPVVELRQYTLHPGQRDVLMSLFEKQFVTGQQASGIRLHGEFTDADQSRPLRLAARISQHVRSSARARRFLWRPRLAGQSQRSQRHDGRLGRRAAAPAGRQRRIHARSQDDRDDGGHHLSPAVARGPGVPALLPRARDPGDGVDRREARGGVEDPRSGEQLSQASDSRGRDTPSYGSPRSTTTRRIAVPSRSSKRRTTARPS